MSASQASIKHNTSTTASSQYSRIESTQTRILAFNPGIEDRPLIAQLHVAEIEHGNRIFVPDLQKRVQYQALSYCWGATNFGHKIICDDIAISITQNLHNALSRIRHESKTFYLWVDALCINQQDSDEKSRHIGNMLTIYAEAEAVIIWLGENMLDNLPMPRAEDLEILTARQDLFTGRHDFRLHDAWFRLQSLHRAPWFQRIWVRQEFWAAKSLLVRWNDVAVDWDEFLQATVAADAYTAYRAMGRRALPSTEVPALLFEDLLAGFFRPLQEVLLSTDQGDPQDRFLQGDASRTDLRNVLNRATGCLCSNSRDHIYGLLGMSRTLLVDRDASTSREARLRVDYRLDAVQVFQDVASYMMHRDQSLNVLYLTAFFGGCIDGNRIPSWVPDWRCMTYSADWLQESQRTGLYLSTKADFQYSGSATDGVLAVQGLHLGTVEENEHSTLFEPCIPRHSAAFSTVIDSILEQVDLPFSGSAPNVFEVGSQLDWRTDLSASINDALKDLGLDVIRKQLTDAGHVEVSIPVAMIAAFRRACYSHESLNAELQDHFNQRTATGTTNGTIALKLPRACFGLIDEESMPVFLLGTSRSFPKTRNVMISPLRHNDNALRELKRHMAETQEPNGSSIASIYGHSWAVPPTTMAGDHIVAVRGGLHPIVLRPAPEYEFLTYIGPTTFSIPSDDSLSLDQVRNCYHSIDLTLQCAHEGSSLTKTIRIL
ncbi:Heterokaryon incompatibility protein 6, OR allele [Pseudocercospora fuligena]|uniref:Heterokaryon incompatibility protein 6, OR allele n=1 Tax=Pseudocercospora fuligena TaxID=685502 RepID=A0A8H6RJM5_9PEZI|nr:Heterokaryon incompatibility protein 6, OR allele [Pseudocercospora fuligena]